MRYEAAQVHTRLDVYANEIYGVDYNKLSDDKQVTVIEGLMRNKVITKSNVTYL